MRAVHGFVSAVVATANDEPVTITAVVTEGFPELPAGMASPPQPRQVPASTSAMVRTTIIQDPR